MRYSSIDLDLDSPQPRDADDGEGWSDGALIVARRGGVPVGSALVHGPRPDSSRLTELISCREGEAAGPGDGAPVAITVAICTRNRAELLARCLASIAESVAHAGAEVDADVLVIDNASTDDRTVHTARTFGAQVHRELVPGLDVARNRAVRAARGTVLAFVDDDVVVDPTWLRTLSRTMRANPAALAVTGGVIALRVDTPAQVEFERSGGFFKGWSAGAVEARTHSDLPFNPSIGVGCNMAFRRAAFEVTGLFDEALDTGRPLAGGGDLDMLIRMAMAGVVIYEPSALVRHEHRQTFDDLRRQYFSWGKSWGAVLHKWYRTSSRHRRVIRGVAVHSVRHYVHDLVLPTKGRRFRSTHAALQLFGFVVGATAAYPRSRRRMEQRRRAVAPTPIDTQPDLDLTA